MRILWARYGRDMDMPRMMKGEKTKSGPRGRIEKVQQ